MRQSQRGDEALRIQACVRARGALSLVAWGLGLIFWIPSHSPVFAFLPGLTLENDSAAVSFSLGRGDLTGLVVKNGGHELIDPEGTGPLWRIALMDGGEILPDQAGTFSSDRSEGGRSEFRMTWSSFNLEHAADLAVTATFTLGSQETKVRCRIGLANLGGLKIRGVAFPRLNGLKQREGESLAAPVWMGHWTNRARELLNPEGGSPRRWEWETPGLLSMQCLAWCGGGGPGILLAAEDVQQLRKQFAVVGDGKAGVGLEVFHQPPQGESDLKDYETPYDTVLTPFTGGWEAAAGIYRDWAIEQRWARESRLKTGRITDWAKETGLWVWNRGRSEGVLEPAALLQEHSGLPVSVFWHWWHGCPYDVWFPEYLPPREGAEPFRKALQKAHGQGVHALVYMNQRLWGMTARSWTEEGAERYAVKGPDGSIRPEVYNTFTQSPCASMCMGTEFWRNKYATVAEGAIELGVDGIYMDQACSSLACYDPTHGHPIGGGSYWMEGFKFLEGDIRRRAQPIRQVTLSGEGCGEAWLPHLDLMLSLQVSMERYAAPGEWEPIPFFQAVYHDHAILYGNYSSLTMPPYDDLWPEEFAPEEPLALLDRKFSPQFRMEQARAFVWGQQPSIANFIPRLLEERAEEMQFVLDLSRIRAKTLRFLRDGVMAPPIDYAAPEAEIPISRLSIYAGQREALKEYVKKVPLVLTTAWRSPEGTTGVAAANLSESPQPLQFTLTSESHEIPDSGVIRVIRAGGAEQPGVFEGGRAEVDFVMEPTSACVIELARE